MKVLLVSTAFSLFVVACGSSSDESEEAALNSSRPMLFDYCLSLCDRARECGVLLRYGEDEVDCPERCGRLNVLAPDNGPCAKERITLADECIVPATQPCIDIDAWKTPDDCDAWCEN